MGRTRPLSSFLAIFAGGALLFIGYVWARHAWEARHPAVKEHLGELMAAAARRMACAAERVAVVAEEPTRARVEGCGQVLTFRWGQERIRRGLPHWHQIDPACRVDYLGCSLPCE